MGVDYYSVKSINLTFDGSSGWFSMIPALTSWWTTSSSMSKSSPERSTHWVGDSWKAFHNSCVEKYEMHAIHFIRVWFKRVFSAQYWILWKIKGLEYWIRNKEGFRKIKCWSFNSLFQEFKRVKNITDTIYRYTFKNYFYLKTVFYIFFTQSRLFTQGQNDQGILRVSSTGFYRKNQGFRVLDILKKKTL